MRGLRWLVCLILPVTGVVLLGGCAPEPVKPAQVMTPVMVPASPQQAGETQQQIMQFDPTARVGRVDLVRTEEKMAAVSGISPADVKKDDTITFTDGRQVPICSGSITYIDPNGTIVVDYSKDPSGHTPSKGNLAVFLKGH